jgi:hypothetical protein
MTAEEQYIKTGGEEKHWLKITQLVLFVSAIVMLLALSFFYRTVAIGRPGILMAASIFAIFNFKNIKEISIVQKTALLYIVEMFFNQISGKFIHIQSFSISLSFVVLIPLAFSCMCQELRSTKTLPVEKNGMLMSWAVVFVIITVHMLILFFLLKGIYGYGYERDFNVLANMCLYFLVFVFLWNQLQGFCFRRMTAIVLTVFFIVIMIEGF